MLASKVNQTQSRLREQSLLQWFSELPGDVDKTRVGVISSQVVSAEIDTGAPKFQSQLRPSAAGFKQISLSVRVLQ